MHELIIKYKSLNIVGYLKTHINESYIDIIKSFIVIPYLQCIVYNLYIFEINTINYELIILISNVLNKFKFHLTHSKEQNITRHDTTIPVNKEPL